MKEPTTSQKTEVSFGREICGALEIAEQREWLVTNGIGGYASGTVSGNLTRRYHGLLVAALNPPVQRVQLVTNTDETAKYDGADYALATNRWDSGAVEPKGYLNIESFRLDGSTPVWRFALADALLEKRIWMQHGANTTYVRYTLLRGSGPVDLAIKTLVNYRDFHSSTHAGDWRMQLDAVKNGMRITAFDGATPFYLLSAEAACEPRDEWYRNCFLLQEQSRGLDDREDHLLAAVFHATLQQNQSVTLVFSTNADAAPDGTAALTQTSARQNELLGKVVFAGCTNRGGSRLDSPARSRRRSIHRQAPAARRTARAFHHRRVSLVCRLGPRHHDRAAGSHSKHRPRGHRPANPAGFCALRRWRHVAQQFSGCRRAPGIQHCGRGAVVF